MTTNEAITTGTIVQYRKVGTFRIVERLPQGQGSDGAGWYLVDPVKAPKRVRDMGRQERYITRHDIVA